MPVYPLTNDWSDPIALQAGDIVQNQTGYAIEITAMDPATDPARLMIPAQGGALQVDAAVSIRGRAAGAGGATLHVIRGF